MFAGTLKCLNCRRPVHGTGSGGQDGPALCEDCAAEEGVKEGVLLELLGEQRRLEQRNCTANALCMDCHSGGLTGKVLCENGECLVSGARSSLSFVLIRALNSARHDELSVGVDGGLCCSQKCPPVVREHLEMVSDHNVYRRCCMRAFRQLQN